MPLELGKRTVEIGPIRLVVLAGPYWSCQNEVMPPAPDAALHRLADLARRRRKLLGLALTDATAKAAGTSKGTWSRVEKGQPIRETNYVKIDRLLKWAPGSCLRILDGSDPVPVDDMAAEAGEAQKSPLETDDADAQRIVQLALLASTTGTTAEEIRKYSERIVRDLREGGFL